MKEENNAGNETQLAEVVERLTRIQKSLQDLQKEATDIRRHIKDFDINMDALNTLVSVRSRAGEDRGAQILVDLFRYARQTGTQLEALGGKPVLVVPEEAPPLIEKGAEHTKERGPRPLFKLLSQLAAALAVTTGLFVLIH